jgi:hypothetical protein
MKHYAFGAAGTRDGRALELATRKSWSRREALALIGSGAVWAAGCPDDAAQNSVASAVPSGANGAAGAGGGGSAASWARGGTRTLAASYSDPFPNSRGASCTITCRETIGSCYAATLERRDVSEGYPGLPVRLALLVVDETCTPLAGASVDI